MTAAIKGVIYKDQEFDLEVEIIDDDTCDEVYPGNRKWYRDGNGDYLYSGGFEELSTNQTTPPTPEQPDAVTGQPGNSTPAPDNQTPPNWQIEKFGIKQIWEKTKGAGVKVAIIDSGLKIDHPEFDRSKIILTRNFLYTGDDETLKSDVTDECGHGTHCAGIIAAKGLKCNGIAPEVQLIIGKIYRKREDGINSTLFVEAVKWAFENDADIISVSLTMDTMSDDEQRTMSSLFIDKPNVMMVGSIENGDDLGFDRADMYPPALTNDCYSVGNIDNNNKIYYTMRCSYIDILAPGYNIYSTWNDGNYKTDSGCSMSTPFVAGIIALLLSFNNQQSQTITKKKIIEMIQNKATSFVSFSSKKDIYPIINPAGLFS